MASKDQEMVIKVSAITSKAVTEIKRLNTEITTLTRRVSRSRTSLGEQENSLNRLRTSASNVSGVLKKLSLGLGTVGLAVKAIDFANMGAEGLQATEAFTKIVEEMGADALVEFEKIKEGAKGLIPDSDIYQASTTAMSLGVPLEALAGLMEVARVTSREMGTDAKTAFEDLAKGIGRGSPKILDNLGLIVKLGDANSNMATQLG